MSNENGMRSGGTEKRMDNWFNRMCEQGREDIHTIWKRCRKHRSQAAFQKYKRARNNWTKTRGEEQNRYETNIID